MFRVLLVYELVWAVTTGACCYLSVKYGWVAVRLAAMALLAMVCGTLALLEFRLIHFRETYVPNAHYIVRTSISSLMAALLSVAVARLYLSRLELMSALYPAAATLGVAHLFGLLTAIILSGSAPDA
jgi:hypothetical protein